MDLVHVVVNKSLKFKLLESPIAFERNLSKISGASLVNRGGVGGVSQQILFTQPTSETANLLWMACLRGCVLLKFIVLPEGWMSGGGAGWDWLAWSNWPTCGFRGSLKILIKNPFLRLSNSLLHTHIYTFEG